MNDDFWIKFETSFLSDSSRNRAMWDAERPQIETRIRDMAESLAPRFEIERILGIGGGGFTLRVIDRDLSGVIDPTTGSMHDDEVAYAVLKIARPLASGANVMNQILRREMDRLTFLRHQNIIRIIQRGTSASGYHYYVMEYMPGVKDSHDFMLQNPGLQSFLKIALGAARGVAHMHANSIYHLDLKPENVFVAATGDVVVADLGFAKRVLAGKDTQFIGGTQGYKHPSYDKLLMDLATAYRDIEDPNREMSTEGFHIDTERFRPVWDIYSLGITFLVLLRFWEIADIRAARSYEHRYIKLMAHRMLDGKVDVAAGLTNGMWNEKRKHAERWIDDSIDRSNPTPQAENLRARRLEIAKRPLVDTSAAGLNVDTLRELAYTEMQQVVEDLEKLSGQRNLIREVPELSYQQSEVIQASSHGPVAFTRRVRALVDSGPIRALAQVDQLGLARLVYPNATHSRLEHTIGTFQITVLYARALYDDPVSPIFKQVMKADDMAVLLAAAIVHDIGHYPLAHDMEEVYAKAFSHEVRTERLLGRSDSGLHEVLTNAKFGWAIDTKRLTRILTSKPADLDFKDSLLKSILDGPLDADKLDYLTRDSENLRLPYGAGIDVSKLIQSLTVLVRPQGPRNIGTVGIREKGRVPAESLAFARYAMYGSVYWHRTHRTAKAMLNRLGLEAVARTVKSASSRRDTNRLIDGLETILGNAENPTLPFASQEDATSPYFDLQTSRLLGWLGEMAGDEYRSLTQDILNRRLYKRVLVVTRARTDDAAWPEISAMFGKLGINYLERRGACIALQRQIRERVGGWIGEPVRQESGVLMTLQEQFLAEADTSPLVIIDFPPTKVGSQAPLGYLREEEWSGESPGALHVEEIEASSVWTSLSREYSYSLGKLRVLVHPTYAPLVRAVVHRDQLLELTMHAIKNPAEAYDDDDDDDDSISA